MKERRTTASRILAGMLLGWLSMVSIEPLGLHSCPMHSAGPMGGHEMSAMSHHGHGTPAPNSHSNQCSCPGDCAGPISSFALIPAVTRLGDAVVFLAPPSVAAPPVEHQRYTPRLQPFANGPPRIS